MTDKNVKVSDYDIIRALEKRHLQKQNPDGFFVEVCIGTAGSRRIDALALAPSWARMRITGYEIKTSRQDFLNDEKWPVYLDSVNVLYFVAPLGIVDPEELDPKVGLVTYNPKRGTLRTAKKAVYQNSDPAWPLLYSIIINRLESDRYPFHSDKAAFFRDWLEHKTESRRLGRYTSTRIAREHDELLGERRHLKRDVEIAGEAVEELRKVRAILSRETGYMSPVDNAAKRLKSFIEGRQNAVFGPHLVADISRARESLERLEAKFKEVEVAK